MILSNQGTHNASKSRWNMEVIVQAGVQGVFLGFKGVSIESIVWWTFPLWEFHGENPPRRKGLVEKISRFGATNFDVILFFVPSFDWSVSCWARSMPVYTVCCELRCFPILWTVRVDYDLNLLRVFLSEFECTPKVWKLPWVLNS